MVEFSPLSDGSVRNGGDRVGVDSAPERLATARVDALYLPAPQKRGTGGTLNLIKIPPEIGATRRPVFTRSSLPISLAIKGNQVHGLRRRCVQLSQHRGDLSAMIGAVIDHVLDHLPKHVRLVITA